MSEKLGNVDLASNHNKLSSETKQLIESEVRRTIEEGRIRATRLLESKRAELELLAKALVNYETLNKEEAYKVIKGEKLEGKSIMPVGAIKRPERGEDLELPAIPGSPEASGTTQANKRPPPKGGVMA
jgi:ATP-dependent metalloprotease